MLNRRMFVLAAAPLLVRALIETGNMAVKADRKDLAIRFFDAAKANAEQLDSMHRDSLLAASAIGLLHAGSIDLAERALDLVADKTQIATVLLAYAREYWRTDSGTKTARMMTTRIASSPVRNPKYSTMTTAMKISRIAMNFPCVTR